MDLLALCQDGIAHLQGFRDFGFKFSIKVLPLVKDLKPGNAVVRVCISGWFPALKYLSRFLLSLKSLEIFTLSKTSLITAGIYGCVSLCLKQRMSYFPKGKLKVSCSSHCLFSTF